VVGLIGATTTRTGLRIRCELDPQKYPRGRRVSDEQIKALKMEHPAGASQTWNYTIRPSVHNLPSDASPDASGLPGSLALS